MWKYIRWVVLAALLAFVVWPLMTPGFIPTHDGEYHLVRIWQFHTMLKAGYMFPRWAPDLNSGYGVPLFNFQYPFPNYVGAFWHSLGLSLADSVKATLATGYVGAVFFCYLWLQAVFPAGSAFFGTVVFMFVPYWFVDVYIRGSVGEVLAMAWVMMALWAIEKRSVRVVALAIGLLVVTHNISAMIFFPIIAFYLLLKRPQMWQALGLGVGLASYFWIPALLEQGYMTGLNTVNYRDHFPKLYQLLIPSWGTGFSGGAMTGNQMSTQIGLVPIAVFGIGFVMAGKRMVRQTYERAVFFWMSVAVIAVVMLFSFSRQLWDMFPMLQMIQYPWRFLAVLIVSAGFFGAYIGTRLPRMVLLFFGVSCVIATYAYIRPVTYAPRSDAYYLSRKNFTDGTSSLGNSLSTVWTGWKKERASSYIDVLSEDAEISDVKKIGLHTHATIRADTDTHIRINTLYYPGWKVYVDRQAVAIRFDDGLMSVAVPKGTHSVDVSFEETALRTVADIASLLSVLYVLCIGALSGSPSRLGKTAGLSS